MAARQPTKWAAVPALIVVLVLGWFSAARAQDPTVPTLPDTTTTSTTTTSTSTTSSTTSTTEQPAESTTTTTARRQQQATTTTVAKSNDAAATSTTSTSTTPTSNPYLVPGGSEQTPADPANPSSVPVSSTSQTSVENSDNTGTVVALVIAGLLVVALLLGLLTYRFWRNTSPSVSHVRTSSTRMPADE